MPPIEGVTSVLSAHREGQPGAFDQLVALVYPELRRIARRQLGRWRPGHTLETRGLVNEAYLKMVDRATVRWDSREHFFAVAARAMRQVIVDYARKRRRQKRGGGAQPAPLEDREVAIQAEIEQRLALDELLDRLQAEEPRLVQVVECRFFAGYNEAETAQALQISIRTVQREWLRARAWLRAASAGETVPWRAGPPRFPL